MGFGVGRERNLGFDYSFPQRLNGLSVAAKIEVQITSDVVQGYGEQQVVDVVAAKMGIAVGGQHLEDAFMQLENGNIKGAAAEIIDGNDAVMLLVEAISQRRSRRFVDQAQNFQTGQAPCIFGGLPLGVVEIGWYSDDRLGNGRAKKPLCILLKLAQHQGGNLGRSKFAFAQFDSQDLAGLNVVGDAKREELEFFLNVVDAAPHEALDRINSTFRMLNQDRARSIAYDELVVLVQTHN